MSTYPSTAVVERCHLAQTTMDPQLQLTLACDSEDEVAGWLVHNPHVTPATLSALALHERIARRAYVATHADLPHSSAYALAIDPDSRPRSALASVVSYPDVQEVLARDPYFRVRQSLADNATLDQSLAPTLAADSSLLVRRTLAENPTTRWTEALPACFWHAYALISLQEYLSKRGLPTDWANLAENWTGSLENLLQALLLLGPRSC